MFTIVFVVSIVVVFAIMAALVADLLSPGVYFSDTTRRLLILLYIVLLCVAIFCYFRR